MGRTLILAGDVGGTKTYLAYFDPQADNYIPVEEKRYDTTAFPSLGDILKTFVEETGIRPQRVVLGVPGPVRQLPVRAVNLPWLIDPAHLRLALDMDQVHLLNDLQATSYGTLTLGDEDVVVLNQGKPDPQGGIAVIAAGTGLGEGGLCWTENGYTSVASEGGHVDFAPSNEIQANLWSYLHERHGHVSWERVISGPGLAHIYDFLRDCGYQEEPAWLREELAQQDRSSLIAQVAQAGRSTLAVQALELFVELYGAETGNLALNLLATGGVFVGGGIAPKLLQQLQSGSFMAAFLNKGRMVEPLRDFPVKVILNDRTALLGAAYWGMHAVPH
ncbi:MAG: glucokinase [Candidatus Latescibacteria bacterium]|nr:glucokinase [Candidatus Latescibacterota bacterium]